MEGSDIRLTVKEMERLRKLCVGTSMRARSREIFGGDGRVYRWALDAAMEGKKGRLSRAKNAELIGKIRAWMQQRAEHLAEAS